MSDEGERLHVTFTDDETREVLEIAESVASCLRTAGHEPPPDPMRALLLAARQWHDFFRYSCSLEASQPHDGPVH